VTPQSGNWVSTSLGNSGLCWTVLAWNRDTAVPTEGNGDLQTLICVLVARPRRCLTLSNPVPWQKLNGGLSLLHSADEYAVSWLTSYGSWHAYEKKKKIRKKMYRYCKEKIDQSQLQWQLGQLLRARTGFYAWPQIFHCPVRPALSFPGVISSQRELSFPWNFCSMEHSLLGTFAAVEQIVLPRLLSLISLVWEQKFHRSESSRERKFLEQLLLRSESSKGAKVPLSKSS